MEELTAITIAEMLRDQDEVLSIKPTHMLLQGPWTEEEVAQAREIVERAYKEAFGDEG